jgi:hypothetical protein
MATLCSARGGDAKVLRKEVMLAITGKFRIVIAIVIAVVIAIANANAEVQVGNPCSGSGPVLCMYTWNRVKLRFDGCLANLGCS